MKVLMQSRVEPQVGASGLEKQLVRTAAELRKLDIEVDIRADSECDLAAYDLLHILCLPDAEAALRGLLNGRRQGKPVVVTPIYWNLRRFETEGRALLREWGPELIDESEEGRSERALVRDIEDLRRQITATGLCVVYRGATLLLPCSATEGRQITSDFDVDPERMSVVYNGADPAFAQGSREAFVDRYGWSDFVICAGRIDPRKNQFSLLKALADETLPVVLVGGTTSPEYLRACQHIAGPNVHFLPALNQEELANAFAAARAHALVTWGEVASVAALEAGLAGCNLAMTTDSSAYEYFEEHAWYCDPGDRRSIREAVLAAYNALPGRAVEWIRGRYTWERAAADTRAAYRRALDQKAPSYEPGPDLERLVALHSELVPLQERRIERLWHDKVESQEYARRLANGRVMRWLNALARWR